MENPFDLYEDTHEDWDSELLKAPPEDDFSYFCYLVKLRKLFKKTAEALTYLKKLNTNLLGEAEKRATVEGLMDESKEKSDLEKQCEKLDLETEKELLPKVKKELGVRDPKNLQETILRVEEILLDIPPADFDRISDYYGVSNGTYSHYVRRVAKQAWNIQNEK